VRAAAVATFRIVPRVAFALPPRLRRRLLALLAVAVVLGAAYLGWFRNSSFVRVEKVTVTGLTTDQAPEIRAALARAGRGMTTLNVDEDALRRAVASNPIVRSLSATGEFPHALRIDVVENVPRALLVGAGRRLPVAGNGTVLPERTMSGSLPTIQLAGALGAGRVKDPATASLVRVAAAAPLAILGRVTRIGRQPGKGIVAQIRQGPVIYFGDTSRLDAKWADAVAVLADRSSQGAAYVDVRLPERPVAGGLTIDAATPPGGVPQAPAPTTPAPAQPVPQATTPQATAPPAATPQTTSPQPAAPAASTAPPAAGTGG
jgi:cell division septal protein FtsQ